MSFWKKNKESVAAEQLEVAPKPPQPGRKGQATPSRKQAEAANQRPLVAGRTPGMGKTKAERQALNERRNREYEAMKTGDISKFPEHEAGPARAWVRDYIDARINPGEYFLVVSMVFVVGILLAQQYAMVALIMIVSLYLYVLWILLDTLILQRKIKKALAERFSAKQIPNRIGFYAFLRALQIRRSRLPKPMVKRGEFPA